MKLIRSVCVVVLFAGKLLWAATGTVHGRVTAGPNRTPIADASIVLRGDGHTFSTTSGDNGQFEFRLVDEGAGYSLSVEAQGLAPFSGKGSLFLLIRRKRSMPIRNWPTFTPTCW
jgi:Carboxypeptidase regulatory-like domain